MLFIYHTLSYPVVTRICNISGRVVFKGEIRSKGMFRQVAVKLRSSHFVVGVAGIDRKSGGTGVVTLHNFQS